MTQIVGKWLAEKSKIFNVKSTCPKVLDLCMAPGGVAATAKKYLRTVLIDAVTLPSHIGGFEVMDKGVCRNIEYADITMYSKEMGLQENISTEHPDYKNFQIDRPFLGNLYDIVICGGAVGDVDRLEPYRKTCERSRLTASQLVFAMNRLTSGGSLVLLLHHVQSWDTVCILNAFNQFSDIELCKHREIRAIGSSFYLVAKNVNLEHPSARASISYWKDLWAYLTFKEFQEIPSPLSTVYMTDDNFAESVKNGFGPHFLRLAKPIWKIQADALRKATFTKHSQQ
ncbi:hypothetical protein N7476_002773 [Penicillium atrosanguineum]|uniref:Ribosomal RNA methyltransferase FtsJ domain-containing protein n=1 Tax=Penicillium atrosanguineum TaxID=1132637 RepID=A0A9W9Q5R2_9EURO|nr:hypothetical protein N7476_002773 [Penicillium atrosanguineum]